MQAPSYQDIKPGDRFLVGTSGYFGERLRF